MAENPYESPNEAVERDDDSRRGKPEGFRWAQLWVYAVVGIAVFMIVGPAAVNTGAQSAGGILNGWGSTLAGGVVVGVTLYLAIFALNRRASRERE